jgi:hypothetical protein
MGSPAIFGDFCLFLASVLTVQPHEFGKPGLAIQRLSLYNI